MIQQGESTQNAKIKLTSKITLKLSKKGCVVKKYATAKFHLSLKFLSNLKGILWIKKIQTYLESYFVKKVALFTEVPYE